MGGINKAGYKHQLTVQTKINRFWSKNSNALRMARLREEETELHGALKILKSTG